MKLKITFLSCALALITLNVAVAQKSGSATGMGSEQPKFKMGFKDGWAVGLNAGSLLFWGDVRQFDYYPVSKYENERQYGYGLSVSKLFSSVFGLEAHVLNGKLSGTRRANKATYISKKGMYFNADVFEYGCQGIVNLSNIPFTGIVKPRRYTVYMTLGAGITNFRTVLKELGTNRYLRSYGFTKTGGELPRTTEVVYPLGIGVKFRLNSKFDIGGEGKLHNVNTDKLDAVVTTKTSRDKYSYWSVNVYYKFDKKRETEVVEWVNPLTAMYNDIENMKTKVDGLTNDKDKDGVADIFDRDNNTTEGVKVYGDGTSVDTDMDGVADVADSEPFSSKGARVDANGKEVDGDGDGVPDSRDLEANTPKGNLVNFQGVTIPTSTVSAEKQPGGALVDITAAGFIPSIFFETGSSKIEYKHLQNLAAIARILKTNPSIKLSIVGNTDAVGNMSNNDKLSKRRADAVKDHLVKVYGVEGDRLLTEAKGPREPLAKNEPKSGSLFNRRVDFRISK